jgi:hypothetical protein
MEEQKQFAPFSRDKRSRTIEMSIDDGDRSFNHTPEDDGILGQTPLHKSIVTVTGRRG